MSIDDLIKRSETEKHLMPSKNLWREIEYRLDDRDHRTSWRYYLMSAAASLVLIVSAWVYVSSSDAPYSVEDLVSEGTPMYDVELIDQLSDSYETVRLLSRRNG